MTFLQVPDPEILRRIGQIKSEPRTSNLHHWHTRPKAALQKQQCLQFKTNKQEVWTVLQRMEDHAPPCVGMSPHGDDGRRVCSGAGTAQCVSDGQRAHLTNTTGLFCGSFLQMMQRRPFASGFGTKGRMELYEIVRHIFFLLSH